MKKTTTNRMLIGMVVLVWAAVLWRYVYSVDKTPTPTQPVRVSQAAYASQDELDSFALDLSYPDPFLNQSVPVPKPSSPKSAGRSSHQQQLGRVVTLAPSPPIPSIRFHGWVDKGDTLSGRALVSIAGNMASLKAGDERYGVLIQGISATELTVLFDDSTYLIPRK